MSDTTPEAAPTAAPTTPEAAPASTETAPEAAPTPPPAPQAANLRVLMDREQALRTQEDQLKELPTLRAELSRMKGLAKSNPARLIEESGGSLEHFDRARAESGDPTAETRRELQDLKRSIEIRDRESEQQVHQTQLGAIRDNVVRWVDASEDFPFVRALGAGPMVFQHMLNHQKTTGQELSEHAAAKAIDGQLKDLLQKAKHLLADTEETSPAPVTAAPTLTNQHAAAQGSSRKGKLPTIEDAAALLRTASDE